MQEQGARVVAAVVCVCNNYGEELYAVSVITKIDWYLAEFSASPSCSCRCRAQVKSRPWSRNISGNHLLSTFPGNRRSRTRLIYPRIPTSRRTLPALPNGAYLIIRYSFPGILLTTLALANPSHKGVQMVRSLLHTVRIEVCNISTCGCWPHLPD